MQLVQASLRSAFESLPAANLGILGCLPVELMLLALQEVEMRSVFHFHQVNRQARIISTSLCEYNLVSKHGLEGLGGLLHAELAPSNPLKHPFDKLALHIHIRIFCLIALHKLRYLGTSAGYLIIVFLHMMNSLL